MKVCTIEGCDNPIKAKGLCSKHHQRMRRYGTIELYSERGGLFGPKLLRKERKAK